MTGYKNVILGPKFSSDHSGKDDSRRKIGPAVPAYKVLQIESLCELDALMLWLTRKTKNLHMIYKKVVEVVTQENKIEERGLKNRSKA